MVHCLPWVTVAKIKQHVCRGVVSVWMQSDWQAELGVTYTAPVDDYLYGSSNCEPSRDLGGHNVARFNWRLLYLEEEIVCLSTPNARVIPANDP